MSETTTMRAVGATEPVMIAWNAYKASESYANTVKWATHPHGTMEHTEGSLWAAFEQGFRAGSDAMRSHVAEGQR